MKLSLQQWHERFQQQAAWTADLRAFLFSQAGLPDCHKVLEVGCGTGAITQTLPSLCSAAVHGIDLNYDRLNFAQAADEKTRFACADALHLPYVSHEFDLCYSHYLFLWLHEAKNTLQEMMRVTRPGGKVLALAEPDHLARVDAPAELQPLGRLQTRALVKQGVLPDAGRKLAGWFSQAGLSDVQAGVSGFQYAVGELPDWFESEWGTLQADLGFTELIPRLAKLKELDRQAWHSGQRVLWIPTFYAIGTVPD